jgi:3-oxoacyl-[acyl-carrier protein] reductase
MKQCGAKLIISGTRQNVLNDLASELGNDVKTIITDLSNKDDVLNLAKEAEASFGHIDILINNAGITADNLFLRMKDDEWDQVINVNLSAPMRLTRQVIKGMLKRRYGRVIFISSVVGYSGNAGQSNYAASKSALVGFTKSIALEVASRGITCNLIAPGFISTPMTDKLSDDQKKNIVENIPVNRLGKVDDISNGCVYLASDEASFITGTTLHINGGMSMI